MLRSAMRVAPFGARASLPWILLSDPIQTPAAHAIEAAGDAPGVGLLEEDVFFILPLETSLINFDQATNRAEESRLDRA